MDFSVRVAPLAIVPSWVLASLDLETACPSRSCRFEVLFPVPASGHQPFWCRTPSRNKCCRRLNLQNLSMSMRSSDSRPGSSWWTSSSSLRSPFLRSSAHFHFGSLSLTRPPGPCTTGFAGFLRFPRKRAPMYPGGVGTVAEVLENPEKLQATRQWTQLRLSGRTLGNGWSEHAEFVPGECMPHVANTTRATQDSPM